jgi:hypothetical protein
MAKFKLTALYVLLSLMVFLHPVAQAAVAITTTTLANGTVGWSYSNLINTSGGCTPFKWATSGVIPPGLLTSIVNNTKSLKLAGTPTTSGTYGFTATVTGCGGVQNSHSYSVKIYQIGVTISPTSVTLDAGAKQQFASTVTGTSNTSVNWSDSAGSISTSGLYQAPTTGGSYTIKATSAADTTRSASAKASVKTVAVSISPTSATVSTGATKQFTATVAGTTNTAVTWVTTCGSVDSTGLFTAPSTASTCSVTATSVANTTKKATATVTVQAISVSISPTSAAINTGATQQFTSTVLGTSNTSVTWSTTGGTISSSGLYTAPSTTGTYTVTVTSAADITKKATATVSVTTGGGITTTTVNFDNPACPVSGGAALTGNFGGINWDGGPWDCEISGSPVDTTTSTSWYNQVTKAVFSFVTPSVLVSLNVGSSSGNGTFTVSTDAGEVFTKAITGGVASQLITTNFTKQASSVTVEFTGGWTIEVDNIVYSNVPPVTVSVSPQTVTIPSPGQQQFTATVTGTANTAVTWAVTSGSGTIDSTGLFTAPAVSCGGEVDTVAATSTADATKNGSATVTVTSSTGIQHNVALSWTDPDSGVTFNLYRSLTSGSSYTKIQSGIVVKSVSDNTVLSGHTYYYVVTAFDGTNESSYSNQVAAVIPCP